MSGEEQTEEAEKGATAPCEVFIATGGYALKSTELPVN